MYEVSVLAVVASEKGVVVGRLAYREDGDLIDCQRMGVGGKAIPPNVDKVRSLSVLSRWHSLIQLAIIILPVRPRLL